MASLRIKRGTEAERLTITPLEGELIYTTDTLRIYVGNGTTVGGVLIVGQSGFSGLSGISGFSGIGTSGFSGFSGAGLSGYSGNSGYSGINGNSGYSGTSGYSGVSGYSGTAATNILSTTTTTDLNSAASTINTVGKSQGLMVFNTTDNLIYVAGGALATSSWYPSNGSTALNPS